MERRRVAIYHDVLEEACFALPDVPNPVVDPLPKVVAPGVWKRVEPGVEVVVPNPVLPVFV